MLEGTCGHNDHELKNRDAVDAEYIFSSRNVAEYLGLNYLVNYYQFV